MTDSTRPRITFTALATLAVCCALAPSARAEGPKTVRPLHALLITGGCCHDYEGQKKILAEGISARANVRWTVVQEGGTSTDHKVTLFEKPNWADGFDVVVHNACFADVADPAFIARVVEAHRQGTPAVMIHCALHTFRSVPNDDWRKCLGVTSRSHGPQQPIDVKTLQPDHPIMKGFPATWITGNEELYAIEKVWPETVVLAQAYGLDNKKDHAVIWAHPFGKGRVFGTSMAHNDATMKDPVYLDLVTRGLLWACDQLDPSGKPKAGYAASAAR